MNGLEQQYLRECIKALCRARADLLSLECCQAASRHAGRKADTLLLDEMPEETIVTTLCRFYDPHLPLVTEERGTSVALRGSEDEVVCFVDPMDRSSVLARTLPEGTAKVAEVFADKDWIARWQDENGGDVELSGPFGSITAVRHHEVLFNVMINYVSGNVYVACDAVVGRIGIDCVFASGGRSVLRGTREILNLIEPIIFGDGLPPAADQAQRFITYCSGPERKKYESNLVASGIFRDLPIGRIREQLLAYDEPGGPARVLCLQAGNPFGIGFILSNGEKIGEWLGWLAYVRYSNCRLCAFEISFDSSWTRDQILMAPGPAYSVLGNRPTSGTALPQKKFQLNIPKLSFLDNPSRYRGTIIICSASNWETIRNMAIAGCVELRFGGE